MNFLFGALTGVAVFLGLKALNPEDAVVTGFVMFFVGTLHGSALLLYFLKKRINQEVSFERE
jgi:hypothetical protein